VRGNPVNEGGERPVNRPVLLDGIEGTDEHFLHGVARIVARAERARNYDFQTGDQRDQLGAAPVSCAESRQGVHTRQS